MCEEFRARGGTILLTTHFMDEAEKLADRVAILDHGEILVQGTPTELIRSLGGEHVVEFSASREVAEPALRGLLGVSRTGRRGASHLLTSSAPHRTVPALLALLEDEGAALTGLNTHQATLDDVFLAHTGRELREE